MPLSHLLNGGVIGRSIGISNFKIDDLKKLLLTAKITPSVNQVFALSLSIRYPITGLAILRRYDRLSSTRISGKLRKTFTNSRRAMASPSQRTPLCPHLPGLQTGR